MGPDIRVHRYMIYYGFFLTFRMRDPERGQGVIEAA